MFPDVVGYLTSSSGLGMEGNTAGGVTEDVGVQHNYEAAFKANVIDDHDETNFNYSC